jgi:hypothetical protein
MAAGQGFKTFTTGEVLTAGDVNGYLMQGVLVFASAAARNAAITSPQEGQFAFTKDTNGLWYYDGAAWVASGATGDIEGVTAGVGITGGGTSGTVTITNDMATTITASGDIVVGTGSGTYDNLPIGTTNQVLTADTTVSPYKVKWATPAAGGSTYSGASLSNNGTVTVNSNTWTAIPYPQEEWDTDGFHSTSTNNSRFTIPTGKAGKYLFTITLDYEGYNGWANSRISVYKNGSQLKYASQFANGTTGAGFGFTLAGIVDAAVGDYYETFAWQNTGVSRVYYPGVTNSNCTWAYLGA